MIKCLLPAVVCWLAVSACLGDSFQAECLKHWHQWRGPRADGLSPLGDPPVHWDEEQNVRWKTAIPGEGHATPILWGDRIFVLSAVKTDREVATLEPPKAEPPGGYKTPRPMAYYQFVVLCLDRATGQTRWQRVACEVLPHEGRHSTNTYASASPTTDGRRLYVSFGSHGIFCYDVDGQPIWDRDLGEMVTRFGWGEGASPVLYGDRLIVNWDHEGQSFLAVLDAATGETKWRVDRREVTSWSTPRVIEHGGRTQVIVPATRRIMSYDLATGEVIWECGGLSTNVIPCPVTYGDLVICMSGHGKNEVRAIRLDSRGDVTDNPQQVVWQSHSHAPYVPSPLVYGRHLFVTKSNSPILKILDPASGAALRDSVRLPELKSVYASPVGAADRVYLPSREGVTLVIKNQPAWDVLAANRLAEGLDASPVVVGRELFLRGQRHLYKIEAD
ncbi:MAG: PQQ-binding-like beta-propeller repeat protein [Candidatus Anammoximicrobium sp.]|nr:PQQ-binding-like beta-propeller repeat protein [Candidatus Anammoximicrobium sp.]